MHINTHTYIYVWIYTYIQTYTHTIVWHNNHERNTTIIEQKSCDCFFLFFFLVLFTFCEYACLADCFACLVCMYACLPDCVHTYLLTKPNHTELNTEQLDRIRNFIHSIPRLHRFFHQPNHYHKSLLFNRKMSIKRPLFYMSTNTYSYSHNCVYTFKMFANMKDSYCPQFFWLWCKTNLYIATLQQISSKIKIIFV